MRILGLDFNVAAFERRGISVANRPTPTATLFKLQPAQEESAATRAGGKNMPAISSIKVENVKRLDVELKGTPLWELPEDQYQRALDGMERMFAYKYRTMPEAPDLSNYAPIKPYAAVVVGGKVVAEIDNQGATTTSDAVHARIQRIYQNEPEGMSGPEVAQMRAEKIVALMGGKIVPAATAMTQAEFDAYPPLERPEPVMDYEAMKNDPMYLSLQSLTEKRAAYLAQKEAA
jgi:hypothetical protein